MKNNRIRKSHDITTNVNDKGKIIKEEQLYIYVYIFTLLTYFVNYEISADKKYLGLCFVSVALLI